VGVPTPPNPITLGSLPAVQEVLERRVAWKDAEEQALAKIDNKALQGQVQHRLTDVATQVSKDLLARVDAQAIVTVAVYKDPKTNRQALAAVAYEGRSDQLDPSFFARVVADLPQAPRVQQDQGNLELDQTATTHILFFLDHGNLDAGAIPNLKLKQSLSLAATKYRGQERDAELASARMSGNSAAAQAASQQEANRRIAEARAQQQQAGETTASNNSGAVSQSLPVGSLYNGYYGQGYWSPWVAYYSGENVAPVIVAPHVPKKNAANGQNNTNNGPYVNGVLPPDKPAPRDPKTGQPLPPIQPGTAGSNAGNASAAAAAHEQTHTTNTMPNRTVPEGNAAASRTVPQRQEERPAAASEQRSAPAHEAPAPSHPAPAAAHEAPAKK
jgi:hypothetical protein